MNDCTCPTILPHCAISARRGLVLGSSDWNGIDYVEIEDDAQRILCVHLLGRIPKELTAANIRICGGRRIRDIRATSIEIHRAEDPELDDCLRVRVDRAGHFSSYCLCIGVASSQDVDACGYPVGPASETPGWLPYPGFDPRYACVDVTFKAGCPSPLDCATTPGCAPVMRPAPPIDYLAKDYASFRRLLLDRLAVTMPGWNERHVPDIIIALVEILAYVADRLSCYQDAVATEAYLNSARRRVSVRRHLRLVDYRLHEGCNARAFLTITADRDGVLDLGATAFTTRPDALPAQTIIPPTELDRLPQGAAIVFEPLLPPRDTQFAVVAAQSTMHFHTWGDMECCLPAGATRATLVDVAVPATPSADGQVGGMRLQVGDVIIFEEVFGPTTASAADADPARRHAVRLTMVRADRDPVLDQAVIEIEWSAADALPFPLCLSSRTTDCRRIGDVSVARGNVILVDHGRSRSDGPWLVEWTDVPGPCACDGSVQEMLRVAERFAIDLPRPGLAFAQPLAAGVPASALLQQDPRAGLPQIQLAGTPDRPKPDAVTEPWRALHDLLASGADDADYVVEVDDELTAHLRFGDDRLGRRPEAGTSFRATYRIGNGTLGNVGTDSIVCIVANGSELQNLTVRNPLPARGGIDAEPVTEAKLFAPGAIGRRLQRAITAEDYATLALTDPTLQGAAAELVWTGSWYEADVAIDPIGTGDVTVTMRDSIEDMLTAYRRLGHDLAVVPARYVPLAVELTICVEDGFHTADVLTALRGRIGAGVLLDGSKGFFHPDNLVFGEDVAVSRLVSAAQALDGVRHVEVTRLERAPPRPGQPDRSAIIAGLLTLAPSEIAQVDDDPNFPENGTLTFVMRGGR